MLFRSVSSGIDSIYTQIFPISTAIYLAGQEVFIYYDSGNPFMIECWNSILLTIPKHDLKNIDTLPKEYIIAYTSFLKLRLINKSMVHKGLFTGPPIVSQIDIRKSFRKTEYAVFNPLRTDILIDSSDNRWIDDFINKETV